MLPRILPAGYDSGFSPDSVSNLKLWLKGDAGVYSDAGGTTPCTNGQSVAYWRDQSGQGNHFNQTSSPNKPTFSTAGISGHSSVSFSGSSYMNAVANTLRYLQNWTVFVVGLIQDSGGGFVIGNTSDATDGWAVYGALSLLTQQSGATDYLRWDTGEDHSAQGKLYMTYRSTDGSCYARKNGSQTGSQSVSGSVSSYFGRNVWIGGYTTVVSSPGTVAGNLEGLIAEILVYDTDLSETNITKIEQYIASRFSF